MLNKKSITLATGLLTCVTAFSSASAQENILETMTAMAEKKIEHYDKAKNLCDLVKQVIYPKLSEAGIHKVLRGDFEAETMTCSVYLGDKEVGRYLGSYIDERTEEGLAKDLLNAMSRDDWVKVRDELPGLRLLR